VGRRVGFALLTAYIISLKGQPYGLALSLKPDGWRELAPCGLASSPETIDVSCGSKAARNASAAQRPVTSDSGHYGA
jgi:hypothetical protein